MGETCFLSGLPIGKGQLSKEHVVPKSKVPLYIASSEFNIRPAIKIFNSMKGDLFLCQWDDRKYDLCYSALKKWNLKKSDRDCIIKGLSAFDDCIRNPCRYCVLSLLQEYCYAREELAPYRAKWLRELQQGY